MTKQAQNTINLFKGNPVSTIKMALKMQSSSIVSELKDHFNTQDIDELALKLSLGKL